MDGVRAADNPRRLTPGKFVAVVVGAVLTAAAIFVIALFPFYLDKFWSPDFRVDSVSISVDDNNVTKWDISFSVSNPNVDTLLYRRIEVAVGGQRPLNSTVARITPSFWQTGAGYDSTWSNSRDATVYVGLPSPWPALIVDGSEFDIQFLSEYESYSRPEKKGTAVAVCGDDRARFWMSNGVVTMVVGPMPCY